MGRRVVVRTCQMSRRLGAVALAFGLALWSGTAAGGIERVIQISVDGLSGELLESLLDANPELVPNFQRFVDQGATTLDARTDFSYTTTLPNHTSMLSGRPVESPTGDPLDTTHHGYTNNGLPDLEWTLHNQGNPNVPYIASAFDVAHDRGLSTALYASKSKFVIYDQSYNAGTGAADVVGPDDGRDKIDSFATLVTGSPPTAADMNAAYLADMAAAQYSYSFVHYRDPDTFGHGFEWGSPEWYFSVIAVDAYLGDVFALVDSDPGLQGTTAIVLTADHGGFNYNHGNATLPSIYTVPVFVWGPGVARGADLYALNEDVRLDPEDGRPDYTAAVQPIRSGGTGNLALDLLGLPAIAGSSINAAQDLVVFFSGDMDVDGDVDFDDIDPLVLGLSDPATYQAQYGLPPVERGDLDNDGDLDFDDIDPFLGALGIGSSGAGQREVPEPSSVWLGLLALAGIGWFVVPPLGGLRAAIEAA